MTTATILKGTSKKTGHKLWVVMAGSKRLGLFVSRKRAEERVAEHAKRSAASTNRDKRTRDELSALVLTALESMERAAPVAKVAEAVNAKPGRTRSILEALVKVGKVEARSYHTNETQHGWAANMFGGAGVRKVNHRDYQIAS